MTQRNSALEVPTAHAALVSLLVAIGVGNLLAIHCWFGPRLTQPPTAVAQLYPPLAPLPNASASASATLATSAMASTSSTPDTALVPALHFERDEHALHSGHLLLLAHAVEHLRANPTQQVLVRACTDGTGPDDWNELLRRKRALAVVRLLRSRGIDDGRIVVEGCEAGSEGSRNDDPRHRRVELRTR